MLTPELRKELNEKARKIDEFYRTRPKPGPIPYDAWSFKDMPTSKQWHMRGIKTCPDCSGNGFVFIDRGGDAWGWIRCTSCRSKMATAGEIGKS